MSLHRPVALIESETSYVKGGGSHAALGPAVSVLPVLLPMPLSVHKLVRVGVPVPAPLPAGRLI